MTLSRRILNTIPQHTLCCWSKTASELQQTDDITYTDDIRDWRVLWYIVVVTDKVDGFHELNLQ